MRRSCRAGVACATLLCAPALAEDSPFAAAPPQGAQGQLGDQMGLLQTRHIKLWYAGSTCNWRLLDFETRRMRDTIVSAAMTYEHIPVPYVAAMTKALANIGDAALKRDRARFLGAYRDLTATCNACHAAAGVGYVVVQVPTRSPFSDQMFEAEGCPR